MKKLLFCLGASFVLMNFTTQAQSPRMQLFEYFDNTSIPPFGAVANAHFDSLAVTNAGRMAFIKYHVAWGAVTGTDPMNLHNPVQVDKRVKYYNVTTDPRALQDGGRPFPPFFNEQPSKLKQSSLNNRDTISSPFTISVSDSLNAAADTIFTRTVIKKTGTTTGTLAAHVVIIEDVVKFATPPGGSGDTIFRNVFKMMLPDTVGVILPSSMNIGDSLVLNLNWKLTNVYDSTQLSTVSFVQDTATREVLQAGKTGFSGPANFANDAAIFVKSIPYSCDSVAPVLVFHNNGSDTLFTCNIAYQVNSGAVVNVPWTGSLLPGKSSNITLPKMYTAGWDTIHASTSNPNGLPDGFAPNDTIIMTYFLASPPFTMPVAEGFEAGTLPTGWVVYNYHGDGTWVTAPVGGFGQSAKSAKLGFFNIPTLGSYDDFTGPTVDLSASTDTIYCEFNVAYAAYGVSYRDTLKVRVSTDCGLNWTTVYSKGYSTLPTAPNTTNSFVPTATQWRHEAVNLTPFNGNSEVIVQFRGISGYGNNLYIDDVNLSVVTGVEYLDAANYFSIYPNPSSGHFVLTSTKMMPRAVLEISNVMGDRVHREVRDINAKNEINMENVPAGVYFLKIEDQGSSYLRKIVIQ